MASAGSPANLTIGGDRSAPVRRVNGGARFHDLLAEAGNNNILGEMMRSLRDRTSLMFVSVTGEKAAQSWLEHEQIIQKVIAGDERAVSPRLGGRRDARMWPMPPGKPALSRTVQVPTKSARGNRERPYAIAGGNRERSVRSYAPNEIDRTRDNSRIGLTFFAALG